MNSAQARDRFSDIMDEIIALVIEARGLVKEHCPSELARVDAYWSPQIRGIVNAQDQGILGGSMHGMEQTLRAMEGGSLVSTIAKSLKVSDKAADYFLNGGPSHKQEPYGTYLLEVKAALATFGINDEDDDCLKQMVAKGLITQRQLQLWEDNN